MENEQNFWRFSDQLRLQTTNLANLSIGGTENNIWAPPAFIDQKRPEERRNFDIRVGGPVFNQTQKQQQRFNVDVKLKGSSEFNSGFNEGWKFGKNNNNYDGFKASSKKKNNNNNNFDVDGKGKGGGNNNNNNKGSVVDKRFKSLPASESLPRNEAVGGYIFVCNNDTMQENLRRELFGLPPRYRDSVRAITPGLPLFLYNYSTHQLHGIFKAASFGGTNIDPLAWEDKKCPGESRFPAQVRVILKKVCEPLEEDSFRPILHHYDGPKFRLELSIPEALALLDIFEETSH
ncbi:hypothetical protein QJS04_geneDACA012778 [Acorus gramineus]|uniref:DCD domain-containing protein n=2 Tax=Acorus TaxID=4464 RepID=A0AAV9CB14_ACOCL|nr:hypothetical protein QJS04_geneDACA012778 [Acorus gramineus]KAK1285962.1 hypothetical protein QJS10_CPB20g01831 [Acorus calamus]